MLELPIITKVVPILLAGMLLLSDWVNPLIPTVWINHKEQIAYDVPVDDKRITTIMIIDRVAKTETEIFINHEMNGYTVCTRTDQKTGKETIFDNKALGAEEFQKRLTDREKMVIERVKKGVKDDGTH